MIGSHRRKALGIGVRPGERGLSPDFCQGCCRILRSILQLFQNFLARCEAQDSNFCVHQLMVLHSEEARPVCPTEGTVWAGDLGVWDRTEAHCRCS